MKKSKLPPQPRYFRQKDGTLMVTAPMLKVTRQHPQTGKTYTKTIPAVETTSTAGTSCATMYLHEPRDLAFQRLQSLQKEYAEKDKEFFPGNNAILMALGVSEEVGELCHHMLKRAQGLGDKAEHDKEIKDASADILVFLMQLATFEGFDLFENLVRVSDEDVLKRTRKSREARYKKGKKK